MSSGEKQRFKIRLHSGRILGPLDLERVRKLIAKGVLQGDEQGREYPQGEWQPVASIAALADAFLESAERMQSRSISTQGPTGAGKAVNSYEPILGSKDSNPAPPAVETVVLKTVTPIPTQAPLATLVLDTPEEPKGPRKHPGSEKSKGTEEDNDRTIVASPSSERDDTKDSTRVELASPTESEPPAPVHSLLPETTNKGFGSMPSLELQSVSESLAPDTQRSRTSVANEATVVFQRPSAATSSGGSPARSQSEGYRKFKRILAILAVGAIALELSEPAPETAAKARPPLIRPALPKLSPDHADPEKSNKLYREAMGFYVQDTPLGYRKAADKLREAASADSNNVKALAMLASSYLNLIDSSNKDENYFSVISQLINLSRAKQVDLPETVISDVEYFITVNKPEAAQSRIIEFTRTNKNYDVSIPFYVALAAFARGDAAGAAKYLGAIPDDRVFSAKIYYYRGLVAEALGDPANAAVQYKKAISKNPQHSLSRVRLGALAQASNQLRTAEADIRFATKNVELLSPRDLAKAYALQSALELELQKPDLALGNMERALVLDPENSEYNLDYYLLKAKLGASLKSVRNDARMYYFLGEGEKLVRQGRHQEALIQFLNARQARDTSPVPLVKIGELFMYLKDPINARINLKKAAELAPKNVQIWSKYIDVLIQSYEWQEALASMEKFRSLAVPQSVIDKSTADFYAKQDLHAQAQVFYKRAMQREVIDPTVYIAYAKSLMATRNYQEAPFFFALALRMDPLNVDAILGTARCVSETEGLDRGIALLQDELRKGGTARAEILSGIAELYMQRGQWKKAQEFVNQAMEVNPQFAHPWKLQAQIYMNDQNVDKKALDHAIDAYKSYSDRNAADPSGYLERFQIFLTQQKFENADEELARIFALYPKYPGLHYRKGVLYSRMGNFKAALGEFKTELENNPKNVAAYLDLGRTLIEMNDPASSREYFTKAMQLAPQSADPRFWAGYASYLLKDYQAAVTLYREALKYDQGNPTLYKRLGIAYREMGDPVNARWAFRKYLEMEPDASDRAQVEENL